MGVMLSFISSTATKIWKKFERKAYRTAFVGAHISNTVSSQIVKLREKAGWTQTELARRAGMRQSRISTLEDPNYENFEVKTLLRIAAAFDVALTVRFIPYSELARWSGNLSNDDIVVPPFEEDELVEPAPIKSRGKSALEAFLDIPEQSEASHLAEASALPNPRLGPMRLGPIEPPKASAQHELLA
jgi:transcriptional regulator with XRE-family HTH domain